MKEAQYFSLTNLQYRFFYMTLFERNNMQSNYKSSSRNSAISLALIGYEFLFETLLCIGNTFCTGSVTIVWSFYFCIKDKD